MRPIDADALKMLLLEERDKIPLEVVERYSFGVPSPNKHGQSMRGGIRKALRCMEETPTLDYAPVKRGEWEDGAFENSKRCTRCGLYASKIYAPETAVWDYTYCPNCGARMDEKESK